MATKGHHNHPHLTGEHRWGDTGQLIFLFIFLIVWIGDSWILHLSDFPRSYIPDYIRVLLAVGIMFPGWYLARNGMKAVFGTDREKPEVIDQGVFSMVRHPIYTGVILFYLGLVVFTCSLASLGFIFLIFAYYIYLCRYEENLLIKQFGDAYIKYKKNTGMLFPKIFK